MKPREFGNSGIYLSPITFGSMRLDSQRLDFEEAVDLISHLYDNGVTTFHTSHEYDTDAFFCEVLAHFQANKPDAQVQHIAKLGVPHFDEEDFKGSRLRELVEQRLRDLKTDRLDIVQWLVRHQPNDDAHRLPILDRCQEDLNHTWKALQQEGKVGVLTSFPYSVAFAEAVLQTNACRGLVTYLNPLELEMANLLDEMAARGQGYVAIRPFCGGAFTEASLSNSEDGDLREKQLLELLQQLEIPLAEANRFAVQFPLLHPAVTSAMLSVTSVEHADVAITAANEAKVNQDLWQQVINFQLTQV
jgi:aryl-alcohol dehydrogenase-like predicted oxidoreductase